MKSASIQSNLDQLQERLENLRALAAWQKLKQQERKQRRGRPFIIPDSGIEDMLNEYSRFFAIYKAINKQLNSKNAQKSSNDKIDYYKSKLSRLCKQVHKLNIPHRCDEPDFN